MKWNANNAGTTIKGVTTSPPCHELLEPEGSKYSSTKGSATRIATQNIEHDSVAIPDATLLFMVFDAGHKGRPAHPGENTLNGLNVVIFM